MKKILCFGDSNTYGFVPGVGSRYDKNTRWTGVLQNLLGANFQVIEAGCNGRTAFVDSGSLETTGYKVLDSYLSMDLDFVIISIGLNDLQRSYKITDEEIRIGIENYISIIKKSAPIAKIVLASPSCIKKYILDSYFSMMFDEDAIDRSCVFAPIYEECAKNNKCFFIDLNNIADVSPVDGLHYRAEEHLKIGKMFFEFLEKHI